jgi:hypothetical protein
MATDPATKPKLFISYRRDDSSYAAGVIADRLASHFGKDRVIFDVDSIRLGHDFAEQIDREIKSCDLLIAIIGKAWLACGEDGRRRLDDPNDWVRLEIESALGLHVPVIPVLIDKVPIPDQDQLPERMRELTRRQAHAIDPPPNLFRDVDTLVAKIEEIERDKLQARIQAEKGRAAEEVRRENERRTQQLAALDDERRQASAATRGIREDRDKLRAAVERDEERIRESYKRLKAKYQRLDAELAAKENRSQELLQRIDADRERISGVAAPRPDAGAEPDKTRAADPWRSGIKSDQGSSLPTQAPERSPQDEPQKPLKSPMRRILMIGLLLAGIVAVIRIAYLLWPDFVSRTNSSFSSSKKDDSYSSPKGYSSKKASYEKKYSYPQVKK